MVTDILGREIKVGDIVCLAVRSGNSGKLKVRKVCSVELCAWCEQQKYAVSVVSIDDPMIRNKGRVADYENMVVITDLFVGCDLHD
jgi:hypothetical protein